MSKLWEAWPIVGPWQLSPLSGGTNNVVWRVEIADKQYYVLRVISDLSRIPRIHYEAALLEAVTSRQPSFSLPIPLKARSGNIVVLFEQEKITAILDFEFAGVDLRVLEICVALSWWPVNVLGTGKEWDIIDAFGNAYVERFPLNEEELLAFPAIWRLRDATSFVHRMGRYMAGLETDVSIQKRVQHSLWREAWLSTNQETLVQHALAWG